MLELNDFNSKEEAPIRHYAGYIDDIEQVKSIAFVPLGMRDGLEPIVIESKEPNDFANLKHMLRCFYVSEIGRGEIAGYFFRCPNGHIPRGKLNETLLAVHRETFRSNPRYKPVAGFLDVLAGYHAIP